MSWLAADHPRPDAPLAIVRHTADMGVLTDYFSAPSDESTASALEDANSIQVALAKVMEQLILLEIEPKTAALMLYALQIASMNLKRTSLEPESPTMVVIDRESVANRPMGASAWSRIKGLEYDEGHEDSDWKERDPFIIEDEQDPGKKVRWDCLLKFAIDREIALDPECVHRTLGQMSDLLPTKSTQNVEWPFP